MVGGKVPVRLQRIGSKGLIRPGCKTALALGGLSYGGASSSSSGSMLSSRGSPSPLPTAMPGAGGGGGGGAYHGAGGSRRGQGPGRSGICPSGAARVLLPVLLASLLSSLVTYYVILTRTGYAQPEALPVITASRTGDRIDLRMGIQLQQEQKIDAAAATVAFAHLQGAQQQAAAAQQLQQQGADPQAAAAVQQAQQQQQAAAAAAAAVGPAPRSSGQTIHEIHAEQERIAAIINQQQLFGVAEDAKKAAAAAAAKAAQPKPSGPGKFGTGGPGSMKMALVNHAPYHQEIVAGMLHIFR